jgi:hypothetical protein
MVRFICVQQPQQSGGQARAEVVAGVVVCEEKQRVDADIEQQAMYMTQQYTCAKLWQLQQI